MVDKHGPNYLHNAASRSSQRLINWLLEECIDPNLPDRDSWTALHWAAKRGNSKIIEGLKEAGAVSSNEIIYGRTPYMVAMYHHGPSLATGVLELDETVPSK